MTTALSDGETRGSLRAILCVLLEETNRIEWRLMVSIPTSKCEESTHSAIQIANWFAQRASQSGEGLTNLKLQKLLHIANGWHLRFTEKALFVDEVEAWPYGPVVPSVYHAFKVFGSGGISRLGPVAELTGPTLAVAESVWKSYGKLKAITLVAMTHKPESPWSQVYRNGIGRGRVISKIDIKKHYDELSQRYATTRSDRNSVNNQ